jgi:hypothetical protein
MSEEGILQKGWEMVSQCGLIISSLNVAKLSANELPRIPK